jgi:DNA modification methylase
MSNLIKTEYINPTVLKFAKYNPRFISDEAMIGLKASITEFGIVDPFIVNKRNNTIIGGHMRCRAAIEMGIKEVPIVFVDLSLEKEKALNITLNNQNITGDFTAGLGLILNDIKADLPDLYDCLCLDALLADVPEIPEPEGGGNTDPNKVPDTSPDPFVKTGDLITLNTKNSNSHNILVGDALNECDIERLMAKRKASLLYCDPPYGMNLNTDFSGMINKLDFAKETNVKRGKKYDAVINDDKNFDPAPLIKIFNYCKEQFWWGADYYAERIKEKNNGSWIVWDKRLDESADKMYGSSFELCWSRFKHKRDIVRIKWAGIFGIKQEFDHKRYHPNQKPVALSQWFIERYSKEGDLVFDGFLGSGSALIACETTNRICRGIEISPSNVQVCIQRWIDFTGRPEDVTIERDGKEYGWEEIKTPQN